MLCPNSHASAARGQTCNKARSAFTGDARWWQRFLWAPQRRADQYGVSASPSMPGLGTVSRVLLIALAVWALAPTAGAASALQEKARKLTQKYPLVDGHIDVPYRMQDSWRDVAQPTPDRDFDYPRARAGGLDVVFMSIYTPAGSEDDGTAYELANQLIDGVEATVYRHPDKFAMAYSVAQAQAAFTEGKIAFALGMENGAPIAGNLENLAHFYGRGVRYITLAHAQSNHISDSSYDDIRYWGGLSTFGVAVVQQMNRLGVMVDVSHLSDAAVEDVLRLSRAPVIASHSSARHFTPDFERNLSDELIKKIGRNGGVVMINFGSSFVTAQANAYSDAYRKAANAYAERHNPDAGADAMRAFEEAYRARNPYPFATVAEVADHVDHVKKLVGIAHVGLGSDYDGVGNSLPVGLKDVAGYPNLVAELLERGYGEDDIEKLLGGNLLRAWKRVEEVAD